MSSSEALGVIVRSSWFYWVLLGSSEFEGALVSSRTSSESLVSSSEF